MRIGCVVEANVLAVKTTDSQDGIFVEKIYEGNRMDNTEIADLANKFTDASQIAGMEVVAVALILFAVGVIIGVLIFDVLSKRWHA